MLIQVVPGLAYYLIRKRQGAFSDEDVSVRQQRNELYLFSFFVLAVGTAVVWLAGAPVVFRALLVGGLLLNMLCWAINLRWKISVHAASSASCATIALMLVPPLGAALWVGALLVGWARVRTHNHTPAQVAAGWGAGVRDGRRDVPGVWGRLRARERESVEVGNVLRSAALCSKKPPRHRDADQRQR